MKKIIQIIKSIRLKQVLTTILASCLLLIGTACSSDNVAQADGSSYVDTGKRAMSDTYDEYDANQSFKGGMNGYNDDRRYDGQTKAKAKELIDTAERRQTENIGDYTKNIIDRAGDNIDEATTEVPRAVKANAENAAQDIKQRTNTLKNNLSNAGDEAAEVVNEAKNTAQSAARDASQAAKNATREVKSNLEDVS